jgi:drug/metabolite transporter (DMT)-like permease
MKGSVVAIVLCGAMMHAGWNALVKAGRDTALSAVLVNAGAAVIALVALPWLAQPARESWPYIAASVIAEVAYFSLLVAAYRRGDMSQAYPLMRGTAPLLVAIASGFIIGEHLSVAQWVGVALICGGVIGLVAEPTRRTSWFALANAVVIATYTLIDGIGVRHSGAPVAYTFWIFLLNGAALTIWALVARGGEAMRYARGQVGVALLGGAAATGSYGLALWAMTVAPIAAVAALRETSILFAAAISALVLRERVGAQRYIATGLIAAGAAVIRL